MRSPAQCSRAGLYHALMTEELRRCAECGEEKPTTSEHWQLRNGKPFRRKCRACQRKVHAAAMAAAREAAKEADPEGYKAKLAEEQRQWRANNPELARERQRGYSKAYRDRQREGS